MTHTSPSRMARLASGFLALFCAVWSATLTATERAVVIGISEYVTDISNQEIVRQRRIKNLPAAKPDADLFAELLVQRFEFERSNIRLLTDAEATRSAILDAIGNVLVDESEPGDVAVLYFAGHGSQASNANSDEIDKLDETLLPVDSVAGAPDIRDKELRRLLNKILDQGAELIVVVDACHSGSVTRGFSLPTRVPRGVKPSTQPWESIDPGPQPSTRGAIVLTSAADSQLARDGAFTAALRDALVAGERSEPAQDMFRRLKATMQSQGLTQEPALAATSARRLRPFIPIVDPFEVQPNSFAVTHLDESTATVLIQGGESIGLHPGTTLVPASGGDNVVLNVKGHLDLTRTLATFRKGGIEDVTVGDLMVVRSIAVAPSSGLSVWLGDITEDGDKDFEKLQTIRKRLAERWVEDPTITTPDWFLSYSDAVWSLYRSGDDPERLSWQELNVQEILAEIGDSARLFVSLPIDADRREEFVTRIEAGLTPIVLADSAAQADYALVTRLTEGGRVQAWIIPNAVESAWRSPLPIRTDWVGTEELDVLFEYLRRISRIKGWLSLRSPTGAEPFAYELVFEGRVGRQIRQGGVQHIGEVYDVKLRLRDNLDDDRFTLARRFVYLLALDSFGASHLLWPQDCESASTELLPGEALLSRAPEEILLLSGLSVNPPAGIDTILMLTSAAAVDDPCSLEAAGVRTRLPGRDPLSLVLGQVGQRTRRPALVPLDWTIDHYVFETVEP